MTVKTDDGDFDCYVARPAAPGAAPAVVVIQEIFGVNRFIRATADRLAAQGYLAVAPDLFWRIKPGIDITDQTEAEWKEAFGYYNAFDVAKGVEDIAATIDTVRADPGCDGKVGAIGFCLGGLLAFLTATRTNVDASVVYYGGGMDDFLGEADQLRRPLLVQLAGDDAYIPKTAQDKITAALGGRPEVELHIYPRRDHAFARVGGQNYHAADAETANARTAAFLGRTIG
ncbi:MAG TPA: dienelactone hydrolase family protein [Caulobacteraceae bacterium]|jgi:carboxymethylenebutenolidase|nr:dienelactone hydrolase family protein [Caulobacteraceae bacterium]